jgi:hypothetical protein
LLPPELWLSSWGCLISSMKASAIFAELLRISAATKGNLHKQSSLIPYLWAWVLFDGSSGVRVANLMSCTRFSFLVRNSISL